MLRYIIIRGFETLDFCDSIVEAFKFPDSPVGIDLLDGEDQGNVLYKSNRSSECYYKYLVGLRTIPQKERLKDLTGLDFNNSINARCLPTFAYGLNGEIKAHRGVQKENNLEEYQEYVAVLQLTQRGLDFDMGRFYLNMKAEASADGKTVTNDNPEDRFYPMLNKGDLILFHNPTTVHGVEPVLAGKTEGEAFRATCSWRTNDKQVNPILHIHNSMAVEIAGM